MNEPNNTNPDAANPQDDEWRVNIERFTGFAAPYDAYRPSPPAVLPDLLALLARAARLKLVVDLGCGTGLSTRIWAARADSVVGIDPSDDMLRQAVAITQAVNVSYRRGLSHETGLPGHGADVVTCSQSLHWMEPAGTFAEAARVLRPGGVFAAYDCSWPPATACWQIGHAYRSLMDRAAKLAVRHGLTRGLKQWQKEGHLARMRASGRFRAVNEIFLHSVESGNAGRFVGLAVSQGMIAGLLKIGVAESEIGIDEFRDLAATTLGDEMTPWYFSYRVRVGVV